MHYNILTHLPPVPVELIKLTLDYESVNSFDPYVNNPRTNYMDRTIVRDNKVEQNKMFYKYSLHPDLLEWIKINISNEFSGCSLARTTQVDGSIVAPHIDRTREYTLIYLLETGGNEHRTVFYETIDKSIKYTRGLQLDYNQVKEIDSVQIPLYCWTMLNAAVPHSVENIPNTRLAIQLGFEKNPWQDLV